jgi:methionyl-tRNA formyltransferase
MKIWIITMEDPLYTTDFIKDIIKARHRDIVGLTIAKGGRLKIGKKRSKIVYLFSLLLIMGPRHFLKNIHKTLIFRIQKTLSDSVPGMNSPGLAGYASDFNIQVSYTTNPNDELFLENIRNAEPDVIINQSQFIIKKPLLELAKIGMLNRHNALLPKNRGRLTPFWVLYNGDKETGVSIHFVDEGIDAGEIVVQKKFAVSNGETFNSLVEKNYEVASKAMLKALELIEKGESNFMANDDNAATYNTVPAFNDALRFRLRSLRKYRHLLIFSYVLFVIALQVIQWGSDIAFDSISILTFRADYLLHIAIFLPWMGLVRLNLSGKPLKPNVLSKWAVLPGKLSLITHRMVNSAIFWFFAGLLLAAVAEVIQYWLPYRSFNEMDMLANAVGVILGCIVYIDRLFRS